MKLLAVNFHYIRSEKYKNGIYPRSLFEFSKQIEELSKYYEFISQNDLSEIIINNKFDNKNYCLLTFDDGFKEQLNALDLLNKKGIPCVFYITTDPIKNIRVVNVHKLHYIRSVIDDIDISNFIKSNIDYSVVKYPDNINELYRYDNLETKKLKYLLNFILDNNTKDILIDNLFKQFVDEKDFSKKLYMSVEDIKKIDNYGYLGTHCDLHTPLATLEDNEIRKDIKKSINFLNDISNNKNIKSISYPYGGPKAVSKKVAEIAKEFNLKFGLTMIRGINRNEDFEKPLLLKRVDTNDAPGGKLNSKEFCI